MPMTAFWADLKKGLRTGYKTASDKTVQLTRIGRIRVELLAVKKEIEELMLELGGRVYEDALESSGNSVRIDQDMQRNIERIKSLQEELDILQDRLEKVKTNQMNTPVV